MELTTDFADETATEVTVETIEQKQARKLQRWREWGERMTFLRTIHAEIEPQLEKRRAAQHFLDTGYTID